LDRIPESPPGLRTVNSSGGEPNPRSLTALEWLGLIGGFAVCLAGFAALTELVVHRWLGLAHDPVTGSALLFFGGWWALSAGRRLRSGLRQTTSGSAWHPALLAYAGSLPRVAGLAFLAILATSALRRLIGGW
jgi:hypothetical protein